MSITVINRSLLFLLIIVHNSGDAAPAFEQEQLSLIQQQLDTIKHIATRAETTITGESGERYRFDYPRLTQDIQRIRLGVKGYLSPSRAQPHDPSDLAGDYRLDAPPPEPSP